MQLNKEAAEGFGQARYWVRPRLDTSGISGLTTLLSGAYIGADSTVDETTDKFEGLERTPIVTAT